MHFSRQLLLLYQQLMALNSGNRGSNLVAQRLFFVFFLRISAALSKIDLSVSCWILLLERAPHGLE